MYINKMQNWVVRCICFICLTVFGAIEIFMVMGLGIDFVEGNQTIHPIYGIVVFCAIILAICFRVSYYQNKVKVYDSFFATDADGVVYPRILAASLGISEERVLKDLRRLITKGYFHDCKLVQGEKGEMQVILTNPKITEANRMRYRAVNCKNCGGENMVRDGFVYGCKYCQGRIE